MQCPSREIQSGLGDGFLGEWLDKGSTWYAATHWVSGWICRLYTSDAADEKRGGELGGRRKEKKKNREKRVREGCRTIEEGKKRRKGRDVGRREGTKREARE